jgi:hypothetical protein
VHRRLYTLKDCDLMEVGIDLELAKLNVFDVELAENNFLKNSQSNAFQAWPCFGLRLLFSISCYVPPLTRKHTCSEAAITV